MALQNIDYYDIYTNNLRKAAGQDSARASGESSIADRTVMPHIESVTVSSDGTIYINGDETNYHIITGPKGESAYEIAVKYGYEGTEEEWIRLIMSAMEYIPFEDIKESE